MLLPIHVLLLLHLDLDMLFSSSFLLAIELVRLLECRSVGALFRLLGCPVVGVVALLLDRHVVGVHIWLLGRRLGVLVRHLLLSFPCCWWYCFSCCVDAVVDLLCVSVCSEPLLQPSPPPAADEASSKLPAPHT